MARDIQTNSQPLAGAISHPLAMLEYKYNFSFEIAFICASHSSEEVQSGDTFVVELLVLECIQAVKFGLGELILVHVQAIHQQSFIYMPKHIGTALGEVCFCQVDAQVGQALNDLGILQNGKRVRLLALRHAAAAHARAA